jgi:transcriptional regulator with XRE-family HTH domain
MVRQRRLNLGIRLKRLAAALEISPATLSRYERGERMWPPELYDKAAQALGLNSLLQAERYWTWKQHRRFWDSWAVETDPGQSWLDVENSTVELVPGEQFSNQPPSDFKRQTRADSRLEATTYSSLCAAGASYGYISLVAMSFPHHPLIAENRRPMSMARRAALVLDDWILWPQVNLLVNGRKVRLDLLAYNGHYWVGIELDSKLHEAQRAYDLKRDQALGFPVCRFTQEEIFSRKFPALLLARLNGLAG